MVGVPVTVTASLNVHVIEIASPTPYAASVAAHPVISGVLPSTITAPRSTVPVAAAAPPAASASVPLNELTERSVSYTHLRAHET